MDFACIEWWTAGYISESIEERRLAVVARRPLASASFLAGRPAFHFYVEGGPVGSTWLAHVYLPIGSCQS